VKPLADDFLTQSDALHVPRPTLLQAGARRDVAAGDLCAAQLVVSVENSRWKETTRTP